MDYDQITLEIKKGASDSDDVILSSHSHRQFVLNLSQNNVEDIKNFFENIFNYIISHNKLIKFELDDPNEGELFHKVSLDIINQLNAEIKDSEANFLELINLENKVKNESRDKVEL